MTTKGQNTNFLYAGESVCHAYISKLQSANSFIALANIRSNINNLKKFQPRQQLSWLTFIL